MLTEYPRCALVMTLQYRQSSVSPGSSLSQFTEVTYIVPLDASFAVIFTDIQSPGLTRSPSMVNAASGYHSHHADALWPPFELT